MYNTPYEFLRGVFRQSDKRGLRKRMSDTWEDTII